MVVQFGTVVGEFAFGRVQLVTGVGDSLTFRAVGVRVGKDAVFNESYAEGAKFGVNPFAEGLG